MVTERDGYQCCEMKNCLAAPHGVPHPVGVTNIPGENLYSVFHILREGIDPSPGPERIIVDKRPDIISFCNKQFCQMAADKSACPCNKDFAHFFYSFLSTISLNFCSFS